MDTRKQGNLQALPVDDVATAHLDLLAEGEGYVRKAPGVMSMKIENC
jgi:formate dehydrogenase maturation protein FdhE